MFRARILAVTLGLSATSLLPNSAVAMKFLPGSYAVQFYNTSYTCGGTGWTSIGQFYYPGPGKTGATIRQVDASHASVGITTFPVTPAYAVNTWSGTIQGVVLPAGIRETSTVTYQFTYTDDRSFSVTVTQTETATGCVSTYNGAGVRTGAAY